MNVKFLRLQLIYAIRFPDILLPPTFCYKGENPINPALAKWLSHFSRVGLLWHHRQQPTRLPCPWGSPGKNTGMGCHFLLQCMKVKSERKVSQLCPTLRDPMHYSLPGSSIHGIFQARVLEWGAIAFSGKWPSKSNILGTCLPSAGIPNWGTWCRAQNPCFLRRNSAIVIILPLWVAHQRVWALTIP